MAYFHCLIGGGSSGGGYELTVTCDADFAGTTITCTDGVTTLTQTCPSASPYEVVFAIPNGGEWTISGIISGQTYSASIDIPDSLELSSIPEGSTVLPTDDIQTWLACAGIKDKSYTTLNEVLSDSTTLLALMSNDNAVDYLVRSTTWASGITADSTAMTDIGANNYCANTLLADSTWRNAICNSTYFESVLNVKVPTMTGATTPSGQVISSGYATNYDAWKAFDGNNSTQGAVSQGANGYIGYKFTEPVKIYKLYFDDANGNHRLKSYQIQSSDTGNSDDWDDVSEELTVPSSFIVNENFFNDTAREYIRIFQLTTQKAGQVNISYFTIQFYGRADV